jgi:hypothetical protein
MDCNCNVDCKCDVVCIHEYECEVCKKSCNDFVMMGVDDFLVCINCAENSKFCRICYKIIEGQPKPNLKGDNMCAEHVGKYVIKLPNSHLTEAKAYDLVKSANGLPLEISVTKNLWIEMEGVAIFGILEILEELIEELIVIKTHHYSRDLTAQEFHKLSIKLMCLMIKSQNRSSNHFREAIKTIQLMLNKKELSYFLVIRKAVELMTRHTHIRN